MRHESQIYSNFTHRIDLCIYSIRKRTLSADRLCGFPRSVIYLYKKYNVTQSALVQFLSDVLLRILYLRDFHYIH